MCQTCQLTLIERICSRSIDPPQYAVSDIRVPLPLSLFRLLTTEELSERCNDLSLHNKLFAIRSTEPLGLGNQIDYTFEAGLVCCLEGPLPSRKNLSGSIQLPHLLSPIDLLQNEIFSNSKWIVVMNRPLLSECNESITKELFSFEVKFSHCFSLKRVDDESLFVTFLSYVFIASSGLLSDNH